jgi:hypothetical protein
LYPTIRIPKVLANQESTAIPHAEYLSVSEPRILGKTLEKLRSACQRIRYADHETNYCARCQTGGRILADRALSKLLGADWPRTLDELEALKGR